MMNGYQNRSMHPASNAATMTGKVVFWSDERGFGFIQRDDGGADVFVHARQLIAGSGELQAGDRVRFEIGTNSRSGKTEALDVTLIDEVTP
jgi:cold shock CspA family protein